MCRVAVIFMFVMHNIHQQGAAGKMMSWTRSMHHSCEEPRGPRITSGVVLYSNGTPSSKGSDRKGVLPTTSLTIRCATFTTFRHLLTGKEAHCKAGPSEPSYSGPAGRCHKPNDLMLSPAGQVTVEHHPKQRTGRAQRSHQAYSRDHFRSLANTPR